ncbi:MAG: ATP-binding protein [Bacteroidales bacterium]|nr:ATP-binding protein [Bacteroidales bacterium]
MIKLKTIYERVILLLSISAIIFLLLFTSLYFYTLIQEKQVYDSAQTQFYNEVESLLDLNSESMRIAVNDFTSSDDLVEFTKSRSTKWYNEHIIGAINSLKVDYICVYDTAFNIISETSSLKILSRRFIPRSAVSEMLKLRYSNFFLLTTEGLVEVSAASIHPTFDRFHNKTQPSGYVFLVRFWDLSFKTKLSKITSSHVDFQQLSDQKNSSDHSVLSVSKNLTSADHKTVSHIVFNRDFNLNFRTSKSLLLITVISFMLGMVVYIVYARLWIYQPLNLITKILESENTTAISKLQQSAGEFSYIGILFEDYFNQRKTLELAKQKAEESDKLKSAFLSNIAHEIRTPMHGILGFADMLKTASLSAEQMQEYITIIEKSSARMLNTITDLIEISRIESGQTEINQSLINIDGQLDSIYAIFKPEADKKGVHLTISNNSETEGSHIRTDREKLDTILTQLLKNAIKYTKRGSIEIGYVLKGKYIEYFVKDTGIGIEMDKQQAIFGRFTQADNSLSKIYEGAGLGLSITKAYVEMLDGIIWVESEPGKGSTFYFTLPAETDI